MHSVAVQDESFSCFPFVETISAENSIHFEMVDSARGVRVPREKKALRLTLQPRNRNEGIENIWFTTNRIIGTRTGRKRNPMNIKEASTSTPTGIGFVGFMVMVGRVSLTTLTAIIALCQRLYHFQRYLSLPHISGYLRDKAHWGVVESDGVFSCHTPLS